MRLNKKKNTLAISLALLLSSEAYANLEVNISYLKQEIDKGPVLSNILPEPENAGIQGAKLAIQDSNTTGRFLKHKYDLKDYSHSDATQLLMQAQQQYSEGTRFFVLNTDAKTLKEITKALPADALFFNAGTQDDDLRQ
ncbi:MAG: branched-chain amino acid ABC transporter substrate-binding protein, partial [Oceanospirillaceae bacterium]|nr:branched-chain amino acid ABC transporter substrate-binding protein [Oceanospirillaceae bacterium]